MLKAQEKLNFLLEKYSVDARPQLSEDLKTLTLDGKTYKLLPWRNERRFEELKKIVDTTLGNVSHFKIMSINSEDQTLDDIELRELDTAEYICNFRMTEIFRCTNERGRSVCCATDKGPVVTLELSNTLKQGEDTVDKHEIISDRGTACDRVVDSQTPLASITVYGEEKEQFTDTDFELYGLSALEISTVRQAFAIAKNKALGEENNRVYARLEEMLKKSAESEATFANVVL